MLVKVSFYRNASIHLNFHILKCNDIKDAVVWAKNNIPLIKDLKGIAARIPSHEKMKLITYTIGNQRFTLDIKAFNIKTIGVVELSEGILIVHSSISEFPLYIKNLKLTDRSNEIYNLNYICGKDLFSMVAQEIKRRIVNEDYGNTLSLLSINNSNVVSRGYVIKEDDVIKFSYKSIWDYDKYHVTYKKAEVIDIRKKMYKKEEKVKKVVKKRVVKKKV